MRDLIVSIFGTYTPVSDASGIVPSGAAGVDWTFVGGIVLFAIVLLSFFKLLGVVIKR